MISLLLNVLLLAGYGIKRYYFSHSKEIKNDWGDLWNKDRNSVFDLLEIDSTDIVFVGSSLTEGFPLGELYPNLVIKNRGIGWNESRHVVDRIPLIAARHPNKIFLEMGVNDILNKGSFDTVFENYRKTIEIIRTLSPNTFIYVQSVMPMGTNNQYCQACVLALNKRLEGYCDLYTLRFIDIYSSLYKNGGLDSAYTYDGIHLNGAGYKLWQQAIDRSVRGAEFWIN